MGCFLIGLLVLVLGSSVAHAEVRQGFLYTPKQIQIDAHFPLLISGSEDSNGSYRYDDRFWKLEQNNGVTYLKARRDVQVESLCKTHHLKTGNSAGAINIDGNVKNSIIINKSTGSSVKVVECLQHIAKAEIQIPTRLPVKAKLQASDFWIRDYRADLEIDLVDGDLWLENISGLVQVCSSGNGDAKISNFVGNLEIDVQGNSDVTVRDSSIDSLNIKVTENADATIGPNVKSHKTQVSGDVDSVAFVR